jgi:hypothetical protein
MPNQFVYECVVAFAEKGCRHCGPRHDTDPGQEENEKHFKHAFAIRTEEKLNTCLEMERPQMQFVMHETEPMWEHQFNQCIHAYNCPCKLITDLIK